MSSSQAPDSSDAPSTRAASRAQSAERGPLARLFASAKHRPMVLCLGAVALHWLVTVPKGETEAKPPPKRKAPAASVAKQQRNAKRSATKLRLLRKTWQGRGLAEEPRVERFAKRHEVILRRRVQALMRERRSQGQQTDGLRDHYECRTVRCSVGLCGLATSVSGILDDLQASQLDGKAPFSIAQRFPYVEERAKPLADNEKCEQLLLSFTSDVPVGGVLKSPQAKPIKP